MSFLYKLFHKIEEKGTFPYEFYENKITLILKPDKNTTRKKDHRPISHEHRYKNSSENIIKLDPATYTKEVCIMTNWDLSQECKFSLTSKNQLI